MINSLTNRNANLSKLRIRTPTLWAIQAFIDLNTLLSDHAYLERKAASNALEMLNRWPEPARPKKWSRTLAKIAQDETSHLHSILKILESKGGRLERLHRSDYANELRQLVRRGKGPLEILDRLLVCAVIEARSCERFELLAEACEDKQLKTFYKTLWASEMGHHMTFLDLAKEFISEEKVAARWDEILTEEAEIIQKQKPGPYIHSWV